MSASFCNDGISLSTTNGELAGRWTHVVGWNLFRVSDIYRAHEHKFRLAVSLDLFDGIEDFDRSFEIDLPGPLRCSFSIISRFPARTSTKVDDVGVLKDLRELGNGGGFK